MNAVPSTCNCPPQQACCCKLVCFDRPNYFCGHLLSDADLTLQQQYVLEKNKLYHRTMDGWGVVCGLKLTCDCDCKGNIRVHDGFAIDDCGNDLVVCEATRFDVIAALEAKGLLLTEVAEREAECEPRRRQPVCEIKQCFYVTICYQETESGYETPFQSSCTAQPKQCLPTRVHEGYRFDVTDKLQPHPNYLDELEKRIRECFEINCDSPVGVLIKRHSEELLAVFGDDEQVYRELRLDPCELFCRLRAYFLNHLKVKPDRFNCGLFDEVASLTCPGECRPDSDQQRDLEWRARYRDELREAFGSLLYCMQRYQYDCVYGDLIFSCQQPCEAQCLVLGTVEVVNGKLTRVCNTPRKYLWAPANLLQVLTYEVMSGKAAAEPASRDGAERGPCCPSYPRFEPTEFLKEFQINECGRRFAAESAIDSFREVARALQHSFDFTDSMAHAPKLFGHVLEELGAQGEVSSDVLGIRARGSSTHAAALSALSPLQALMSKTLLRPGDTVRGYASSAGVRVLPDFLAELSPDRSVGGEIERKFDEQAREVAELRAEVAELKAALRGNGDQKTTRKPKG